MKKRDLHAIRQRMIDRMVRHMEEPLRRRSDYPRALTELASHLAQQGHQVQARRLCHQAEELGDAFVGRLARQLLGSFVPGYHLPMMNDQVRNSAWDSALRRAVKPGMLALEIGTGGGMLAMMAARAGAQVISCEYHELIAAIAREIIADNGFQDQVTVLAKSSSELRLGADVPQRVDLIFCDNFSDNLLSFQPLQSLSDARRRLAKRDATCVPRAASVRLALGNWRRYSRFFGAEESCGFNLRRARDFAPDSVDLELGDPDVELLSECQEPFRFDFSSTKFPARDTKTLVFEAARECRVNGIVQWIRLELNDEVFLEARPEPGKISFSNPRFHALSREVSMKRGDRLKVTITHNEAELLIYLEEEGEHSSARTPE